MLPGKSTCPGSIYFGGHTLSVNRIDFPGQKTYNKRKINKIRTTFLFAERKVSCLWKTTQRKRPFWRPGTGF